MPEPIEAPVATTETMGMLDVENGKVEIVIAPGQAHPIGDNEWLSLFHELDKDHDGQIPLSELKMCLQERATDLCLSPKNIERMVKDADKNGDKWIDFGEFALLMSDVKNQMITSTSLRLAQLVIPKSQRAEKFSYLAEYKCWPPPLFMICVSLVEIGFYCYYGMTDPIHTGFIEPTENTTLLNSWAVYCGDRHSEVWRFGSVMFLHAGLDHIAFNIVMQLVAGIPLELVHKWWRVAILYLSGVLIGSLTYTTFVDCSCMLGASSGVYALIAAHNWAEMDCPMFPLVLVAAFVGKDLYTIWKEEIMGTAQSNIGHLGHVGGFLSGLLLAIIVLRNLEKKRWEKVVWWISLVTISIYVTVIIIANCRPRDCLAEMYGMMNGTTPMMNGSDYYNANQSSMLFFRM